MRFINVVLLGFIIFNGMLFVSSYFITGGAEAGAVNVTTDETYADYSDFGDPGNLFSIFFSPTGIALTVIGTVTGLALSFLTKSVIPLGVGAFLGIFSAIIVNIYGVIYSITAPYGWVLNALFAIIMICIGIIVLFNVTDALMSQQGSN